MSSTSVLPDSPQEVGEVLAVLADADARIILKTLTEPMTAQELQAECDIPESTLYRKLDRLAEVGLLEERTRLSRDGRHANEYAPTFTELTISRDPTTGEIELAVEPAPQAAEERLARLWGEVRREV